MSTIYFFRHGQAGLRDDYDTLSALGRKQARELGLFLVQKKHLEFKRVLTGAMERQRATLQEVRNMYVIAGEDFPEPEIDPGWSEFDLDGVVSEFAPQLAACDPEFKRQWEQLLLETADCNSHLHRRWTPCDSAIIQAWLTERYPFTGESWKAFQDRVRNTFDRLIETSGDGNIAVFTSATPVGLSVSRTLRFDPLLGLRLAGAQYNTAITTIQIREREPYLISFNATPHLTMFELETLR